MNESLQSALAASRATGGELESISCKTHAAERELSALRQELAALESAVSSAESEHASAEAALQLGEQADIETTEAAVHAARKALMTHASDLQHKIRAGELVASKLAERTQMASAAHAAAQAEVKTAIDEFLTQKIKGERERSVALYEAMTDSGETAYALERILVERGAPYQGGWPLKINRMVPPHDQNVVRAREAILAEIAAITAA